jgi:hypothetical protein
MAESFNHPTEPLLLTLLDGQEYKFLLSMGGLKRLKERFKAKGISDLLQADLVDAGVPILFEALQNKDELKEDKFIDLVPANLEDMGRAILKLFGASMPGPKDRPPVPNLTEIPPRIGTGSNSGPSGMLD